MAYPFKEIQEKWKQKWKWKKFLENLLNKLQKLYKNDKEPENKILIQKHKEIKDENPICPNCQSADFKETKAVEVGNIFKLGTKYSAPFDLKYKDQNGQEQFVIMGCYGLGPARVMGAIVETSHDDKGIIWPENVAPYKYHLLALGDDEAVKKAADELYEKLIGNNFEVLYDDRELAAGQKFAEADLIGLPYRLVISAKTLAKSSVEIKKREEEKTELIKLSKITKSLK